MDDIHVLSTVVKYGSGIEVTLSARRRTTAEHLGALLHGVVHLLRHTLQSSLLNQRTHVNILVDGRVAELDGLELLHDDIGELLLDILVYINALGIVANLTRVADTALQNGLSSQFKVGIGEYDGRGLTAQLEAHLRDIRGCSLHNLHTGSNRTCQAHNTDLRVAGQCIANHRTLTGNHIEKTCGQTAVVNHLTDFAAVLGSNLSGLDNDRATRDKCSSSLAGNQEEREVPRQNTSGHADRLLHQNHGLVGRITLNYLTLNAAGKLSHIVEISGSHAYLDTSQGLCLTLLANKDFLELVEIGTYAIGNLVQIDGTLGSGNLSPLLLSLVGGIHSLLNILNGSGRLTRGNLLGAGVQHFNPLSRTAFNELAVDVHFQVFHVFPIVLIVLLVN